jgi:hypothetical protein
MVHGRDTEAVVVYGIIVGPQHSRDNRLAAAFEVVCTHCPDPPAADQEYLGFSLARHDVPFVFEACQACRAFNLTSYQRIKRRRIAISALSPQLPLLLPVRSGTGKATDIAVEHCQVMATMHCLFSLDKASAFQSLNGRIHIAVAQARGLRSHNVALVRGN